MFLCQTHVKAHGTFINAFFLLGGLNSRYFYVTMSVFFGGNSAPLFPLILCYLIGFCSAPLLLFWRPIFAPWRALLPLAVVDGRFCI